MNTTNVVIGLIVVLVAVLVAVLVGMPLMLIWSLNTLFATGIEYSLTNWAAMLALLVAFNALTVARFGR